MAKTMIGVYDSSIAANSAINDLKASGFKSEDIHLMSGDDFLDQMGGRREGGFLERLKEKLGFGSEEYSASNIHPDDTLLMVDAADDEHASLAADIMDRHGATDIDTRRRGGETKPGMATETEQKIPVVEEELQVGKAVKRGGVRVYSHTTERPVEEQVTLREEQVHVERRPVDRPASEAEMGKGETVEVTATSEEPVIGKKARVKEEVVVSKEAAERVETIRETLRGTEVEVERLSPEEEKEFAIYEDELRSQTAGPEMAGLGYDEVRPYYRYGYHLGNDPKYHDGDWSEVEPKIRSDWESHNYGPWERYKAAVRSGWERSAHHPSH